MRRPAVQAGFGGMKKKEEDDDTSSEDSDGFAAKPSVHIPPKHDQNDSDYTDNSSGVRVNVVMLTAVPHVVDDDTQCDCVFCCCQMWLMSPTSQTCAGPADE